MCWECERTVVKRGTAGHAPHKHTHMCVCNTGLSYYTYVPTAVCASRGEDDVKKKKNASSLFNIIISHTKKHRNYIKKEKLIHDICTGKIENGKTKNKKSGIPINTSCLQGSNKS